MRRVGVLLPVLLALQAGVPPALAWTWPVGGPVLQYFKLGDDPYAGGQHRGIDVGASAGAAVVAPAGGTVSFSGTVPGGGRTVTIETADGYSVTLVHLGTVSVGRGSAVVEGEAVGTVGPSGTPEVAGPYVHLGIRLTADENGYVDPLELLPAQAGEQSTPDAVAGVGGEGVPETDPAEATPAADPTTTTAADPPSATPPAQPPEAAQEEEVPAPAADDDSTPELSPPPASGDEAVVSPASSVRDEVVPAPPSAAEPPPGPASPSASAAPEAASGVTDGGVSRRARPSERIRPDVGSTSAPVEAPRVPAVPAGRAVSSSALAGRSGAEPARSPVRKPPHRDDAQPRAGIGTAAFGIRASVVSPVETAPASRTGPVPVARSGVSSSVRVELRRDGGFSAWIAALGAVGALAAGAWLGRRQAFRARFAAASGAEEGRPKGATGVEPPVPLLSDQEAFAADLSEEDLRTFERELERLLEPVSERSTMPSRHSETSPLYQSGTPEPSEHEPAELSPALPEWAR